jgi:hypothetical protein
VYKFLNNEDCATLQLWNIRLTFIITRQQEMTLMTIVIESGRVHDDVRQ